MIDIKQKIVEGHVVMVPPPQSAIRAEADKTVGVRMEITPAQATEWLETRGSNRKIMQAVVDAYVAEMKAGRWVFNGAPIQFDEEGKLLNGQHRLWAIIESGTTIEAVVQFGIPRDSQATIDSGMAWKSKDVLFMLGESNTHSLQATLAWMNKEESGSLMSSRKLTSTVALEILERHPNIRKSVEFANIHRSPLVPSGAAYLHYRLAFINSEKADEFFLRLEDGVGLSKNSPIYRLRERLNKAAMAKEKLPAVDQLALTIIAWNYYIEGREIGSLQWRKSGPTAQEFPTIMGLGSLGRHKPKIHRKGKGRSLEPAANGGTRRVPSVHISHHGD